MSYVLDSDWVRPWLTCEIPKWTDILCGRPRYSCALPCAVLTLTLTLAYDFFELKIDTPPHRGTFTTVSVFLRLSSL